MADSKSVNSWLTVSSGPIGATTHVPFAIALRPVNTKTLDENTLYVRPFFSPRRGGVLDKFGIALAVGIAGEKFRMGVYDSISRTTQYPNNLIIDAGEFTTIGGGTTAMWTGTHTLSGGTHFVVVQTEHTVNWNAATADFFAPDIYNVWGVGADLAQRQNELVLGRAYAPLPDPFPDGANFDANGAAIWIGTSWSA